MVDKKLAKFLIEFVQIMDKNSEKGFNIFKREWPNFDQDERDILKGILQGVAGERLETLTTTQLKEALY